MGWVVDNENVSFDFLSNRERWGANDDNAGAKLGQHSVLGR